MSDTSEATDQQQAAIANIEGFIVSRDWQDYVDTRANSSNLELTFWCHTNSGPLVARFVNQQAILFVDSGHLQQAVALLANVLGPADQENGRWHYQALKLKSFRNRPVHGVYFREQRALYSARDLLGQHNVPHYEYDIQPSERFLMERFITGPISLQGELIEHKHFRELLNPRVKPGTLHPRFRVLSLDIETAIVGEQLYSIGLVGIDIAKSSHYEKVFILGDEKSAGKISEDNDNAPDYLEYVSSERQLLKGLLQFLDDFDPDIIIGWNVVNFDLRYLQRVANRLGEPLTLGRAQQKAVWRQSGANNFAENDNDDNGHYTVRIPGRAVLDGIDTLKSATYSFESFSLQNVASEILGRGKLIHDVDNRGEEITLLFKHDKPALAAYNLEDCRLVWDIFERTDLIDFAIQRATMTGLAIDRFGGSVAAFDNRYLPRLHRAGFIAPNLAKDPHGIGSPGGYVMDSQPGIYRDVLVLDFKSLYPSIIRTFKIDPLGLQVARYALHASPDSQAPIRDQQETQITNPAQFVPGYNGAAFSKTSNILPALIAELWQQRDAAKAAHNKALSQSIKILMNSFYGVLGTPGCRFFDYRLPSSITLRGHSILYRSKQLIEALGHRVIYGDTDSVFVEIHGKKLDLSDTNSSEISVVDIGAQLANYLNSWWQNHLRERYKLESFLEIEFETHFKKFLMPTIRGSEKGSKKRYAGLLENGELVFKGLETVRTDWTHAAREFQKELYQRIFFEQPYKAFIIDTVAAIRDQQLDDKLIYRKRIRRPLKEYQRNVPPHVQAARKADQQREKLGKKPRYQHGGWIQYLMTVNGPEEVEFRQSPLDYDLYIERQIKPIADGILHFLGTSFDELTNDQLGLF